MYIRTLDTRVCNLQNVPSFKIHTIDCHKLSLILLFLIKRVTIVTDPEGLYETMFWFNDCKPKISDENFDFAHQKQIKEHHTF